MVFYYTSQNIKILRKILIDYETGRSHDLNPYEYMQEYIGKCPKDIEEVKLIWISHTFLRIQKHKQFLRKLAYHLSDELTEEEQDYFIIVMQAIIFELKPKDANTLYKSLFNLSKTLLNTFTSFLSINEVLTFISNYAQDCYDATFITENIINPLFNWQPYLSDLAHRYAEYVHLLESRKLKAATVPNTPKVLTRKFKKPQPVTTSQPNIPLAPQNSVEKKRKMLTKSAIDRKLKNKHEQNKQNATNLLNTVRGITKTHNYAREKPICQQTKLNVSSHEKETHPLTKPKRIVAKSSLPVRNNNATIKRINNIVKRTEQQEVQWLQDLFSCCRDYQRIEQLIEEDRKESEKERLYDIEKKHLMGKLSYEEAILAKKKIEEENKARYEKFLKEKEEWEKSIEDYKKEQMEKKQAMIKEVNVQEFRVQEAICALNEKKQAEVSIIKKEKERIKKEVMQKRKEDLEAKLNMIKQIRVMEIIAKRTRAPKVIDLTEHSGIGLLCEMSVAELQERLAAMKIAIKEEIERKKDVIREEKDTAKKLLDDAKNSVKEFFEERLEIKEINKLKKNRTPVVLDGDNKTEIDNLKRKLEEKRQLRLKLAS